MIYVTGDTHRDIERFKFQPMKQRPHWLKERRKYYAKLDKRTKTSNI